MTVKKALAVPEGKPFDNSDVRSQLEALGFSSLGGGRYDRPDIASRIASQRQRGVRIEMKLKPDAAKKERVYTIMSPHDKQGGLVYAPETFSAEDVVGKVREWLRGI
jgi:hypothetical protein